MTIVISSFASVVAVSLISLIGLATLSMAEARPRRIATLFLSFAVGGLLGDAFIHLIPETFKAADAAGTPVSRSLFVLGGMMLFFMVEKLLRHRHLLHRQHHDGNDSARPELATLNILGDAIHNFIDGVLIGASYLASPTLGVTTTVAVLLHEIPQELGDFGVLIHSGLSVRKAMLLNLGSASLAILGTAVALLVGSVAQQTIVDVAVPITAGGFVYIAAANLIPELQQDRSFRSIIAQSSLIGLGVAIMGLLTLLE